MKIEIGKDFPQYFKPSYPEEFELFSHFEVTAGIPTASVCDYHLERKREAECVLSLVELLSWGQNCFLCCDGESISAHSYLRQY